jgi:hypothetical protein
MHARELVELAAIVSAHGPALIESGQQIPEPSIEQYWTTSKVRLDRWAWRLKTFVADSTDARRRQDLWPEVRCVIEEILTGEMLTRVWTAVLCAYDKRCGAAEAEPVARSVLIGHTEARHRVLTLLVRATEIDADAAQRLNSLRRRTERWTDLLVGHLARLHDISEFAFEAERARDFAQDMQYRGNMRGGRHVWPLLMASLRAGFRQTLGEESPNTDLNARIAASILSCFPTDLFDSTGLMRSLWLLRLTNMAEDTQCKIDDLLSEEISQVRSPGRSIDLPDHRRRFGG